jgi:hypothetical protein
MPNIDHGGKCRLAADFRPTNRAEAVEHASFCRENFEPWDWHRQRSRGLSLARAIRQAREAGDRGPVRIEHVNADGSRTIVTSASEPTIAQTTDDETPETLRKLIQ